MNDTQKEFEPHTFKALYDAIVKLRSPQGCPWDREQNPQSLRGDLIEEVFECVEAIDQRQPEHIKEELGDIFLLATMISYMHEQEGDFSVEQVLAAVTEKIIRRHPHVFGTLKVKDSAEVLENWARDKVFKEGRAPKDGLLDTVPRGIPPLQRAYKLQQKAAQAGFDWTCIEDVFDKVQEELQELKAALEAADSEALEAEAGDLIFAAVNLCRCLHKDPAVALQGTSARFSARFAFIEKKMKEAGKDLNAENSALMQEYWEQAKGAL
ncbi:MAG: nucleoside triphosphate pyrophosphohydrolase [Spirochaetaceae bacterium]|jgi:tetrapyrrole methylase family protein/MazG family protein|nr:nucleoside triphosphate pyrophosphohydrolase [Spirochaetaceae bacterium]